MVGEKQAQRCVNEKSALHAASQRMIYDCYTGDSLKNYVTAMRVKELRERDFVKGILAYLSNTHNKVYAISGLRGVGKTTGILQAIADLNNYESCVYVVIDEMADMDCKDLRNLLEQCQEKRYIFIDEVTRLHGLISNSGFLADKLVCEGKRVVLSGTDSLSLLKTSGAGLYHRVISKNVTHISYQEAKDTMQVTLPQYIDFGGLYAADAIRDIDGVRRYVETAVIDNIMNTLNKNVQVTSLLGLEKIDRMSLCTMVFRILYAVIYSSMKPSKTTNLLKFINQYEFADSEYYDAGVLNTLVCAEMDVDETIIVSQTQIKSILRAMVDIGILVCVTNLKEQTQKSYYVTNPSIVTQITRSILRVLDMTGLERKAKWNINSTRGLVFESVLMVHTYLMAQRLGCETFFYHDQENHSEIDIVVAKQYDDEFETKFLLYEVKFTGDADVAILKTKWLNDSLVHQDICTYGTIVGKSIIYSGKTQSFEKFVSDLLYPPKDMSLDEICEKNKHTRLVNAEEYLFSLKTLLAEI